MIRVNSELLHYISTQVDQGNDQIYSKTVDAQEKIIQQGRNAFTVFILKEGIAKCYLSDEEGNDFIQEFFGNGQLFGEVEVIHGTLSICSVESVTGCVLYCMKQDYFKWLLLNDREFNDIIIRTLTTKIAYKAHRHSYNQYHSIGNFRSNGILV